MLICQNKPLKYTINQKIDEWLLGAEGMIAKKYGISFGADENALELVVVVAQPCEYIKNQRILYLSEFYGMYITSQCKKVITLHFNLEFLSFHLMSCLILLKHYISMLVKKIKIF